MTTKDGKIKSATVSELQKLYFKYDYCMSMSFEEYMNRVKIAGVKVEVENDN